ncbi:MAG: ABC transporter ATP-binding protein [Fimbriimonadaceae bacterium]|nr:MAG: ABC transporter ATP-binding protein [Fimbriimonadaceae bacterium]
MLKIENLGHRFDQGWLFRHVSAEVEPGGRLLISGRNGSGKSTFLRTIAGLLIPREGEIIAPERVGYSALDLNVYPHLTASEHLEFSAMLRGVKPEPTKWLSQVGLENVNGKLCNAFSTGMRARLKIALALQCKPELLILDEPTASLDDAGRELIDSIMTNFGGAVVYASNDEHDRRWATHELVL